jgi:pre-mRNA-splicing factor RBM22/SLT11
MIKLPFGEKLCKVTNVPYQAFRWKAGPNGRYKETIICYTVAAERNICQTCLNDMKFGLPAGLRDRILNGTEDGHESGSVITLPQSNVGLQYYYQQQNQLISQGLEYDGINTSFSNEIQQLPATKQLQKFSNTMKSVDASSKTAFRNLPKLCSFWLNGACNRVVKKTCPFRPCCGAYAFPEIAGSHKEMCKTLVADLTEHGPAYMMKHLTTEVKQALAQALKGNRDEAIRKRVSGEDDLTHQYLGKMKNMVK